MYQCGGFKNSYVQQMFIQLAFTSKWNKAALLLRCIWLFFEVSCLLFTYFLKILQVNRFSLIRLLYGVAVTRNIFWDSRSVSGNTYPETCFIVDYANKSNPEWISITPILFVCLRPSISAFSSALKIGVVCA